MKLHRINAVIERHIYESRHNFDRVVDMIWWPVLDIIMWGFFTVYLAHSNHLQPNLISCLLGAIILWGTFYSFQRDMAIGFIDELWCRNLVNLFSTPLTLSEYMAGLITVCVLKVMVGLLAAAAIGWAAYSFDIFPWLPQFIPYIANLMLFALALGIAITGMIFRYSTKIQALAWSFAGLLMPVSCVMYPMSSLPKWLQDIAWMLPTAHSFEGMRQVLAGKGFSPLHFWWGAGLNAGVLRDSDRILHLDLREGALARPAGQAGVVRAVEDHPPLSAQRLCDSRLVDCISMKSALNSMMHIEMRTIKRCKKPCGIGLFCIGTRGAVSSVGRVPTEAWHRYETAHRNEISTSVLSKSARQTARSLQATAISLSLRAV